MVELNDFRDKAPGANAARPRVVQLGRYLADSFSSEHEQWILWAPIFFGIGVGGYFAFSIEPSFWVGPGLILLCVALAWFGKSSQVTVLVAIAFGLTGAGFSVAKIRTQLVAAPVLERPYGPGPIIGRVLNIERLPRGPRVVLDMVELRGVPMHRTPTKIRVRLHLQDQPILGERLDLFAKLSPPSRPSMPGGYDFQRRFWFEGIGAIGFTMGRARRPNNTGVADESGAGIWMRRIRQSISDRIRLSVPGASGAVAAALITGDRSAIPKTVMSDMRDSGLAHLLAISGLHLGLVATILFFCARAGLALHERTALRWPIKKIAAMAAFAGTFGYLLMTGGTVPTQRAFIMTGLALLAITLDRSPFSLRLVAFGALLILIFAPDAILGASFQMSFAAVTALIAAYEALGDRLKTWLYSGGRARRASAYLVGVALTTVIASAATGVFAAHHFGRIAYFGLAANLIAVPLTAIWVMPWAIVSMLLLPFGLEGYALVPMTAGIDVITNVAHYVADLPGAVGYVRTGPTMGIAIVALGGLWLCLWRGRWRYLGVIGVVCGALSGSITKLPDVLISESGRLAAVRLEDGRYVLSNTMRERFSGRQWLRSTGQKNTEFWGSASDPNVNCDRLGCIARVKGKTVAFIRDERALADDCVMADIVVSATPVRQKCPSAIAVIDKFDLWRYGAHSIYLSDDEVKTEHVARQHGVRPWSTKRPPARRRFNTAGSNR
jgi:competence protein ComEC